MDLLEATSGPSRGLQVEAPPGTGAHVFTPAGGSLTAAAVDESDDGDCKERLRRARNRIESLVNGAGTRTNKAEDGSNEPPEGKGCEEHVRGAWDESRDTYMGSALQGDTLALRAVLERYNATLAAEWDKEHAAYPQRGILMLAGPRDGNVYLVNAFMTLWVIRHHFKSKLPVVIKYWGEEESVDTEIQEFFEKELGEPSVRFVDASLLPWPAHQRRPFLPKQFYNKRGWAIKLVATYLAPFKEVLYLDVDSTPLVPPETLFDLPAYKRSGSLFWPCIMTGRAKIFEDLIQMGLITEANAPADMIQTESGQMLYDKRRHREALEYVLFLAGRTDFTFKRAYGDKEMFLGGFALAGAAKDYSLVPEKLAFAWSPAKNETRKSTARRLRGVVQFSPVDGRPAFLHRAGHGAQKFRLDAPEGRPVDVISGPLPREWAFDTYKELNSRPWPETMFQVIDPGKCPYSLNRGFPSAAARCGEGFGGKEGEQVPVFAVAGSAMAEVLAAQDVGWKRLLEIRKQNPKLFPMSALGFLKRWTRGS